MPTRARVRSRLVEVFRFPAALLLLTAALICTPWRAGATNDSATKDRAATAPGSVRLAPAMAPDSVRLAPAMAPDSVRLGPLPAGLLIGVVPVAVEVSGERIRRVELRLDGEVNKELKAPNFEGTVFLGVEPRRQTLTAVGLDAEGRAVAQDRRSVNAGFHHFAAHLVEPNPLREFGTGSLDDGGEGRFEIPVEVRVDVPVDHELDRVELFVDDQLVHTLREAPFTDTITASARSRILRAVAHLDDGRSTEALRLLQIRGELDEVDVQLVEMYVSVTRRGDPVTGLKRENFRLLEDGEPQTIERFESIDNLPLNVVVLMDNSGSMKSAITDATESALVFIDSVLTEKDRAAFLAFNHMTQLVSPFTNDLQAMRQAVSQLQPVGGTRLYEAVILATYYFEGREGKKALVVLSDGRDIDSHFTFEQMETFALRSGVAIYTISLESSAMDNSRRAHFRSYLRRLSKNTGGRSFVVSLTQTLDSIYQQIQSELRSQYLLTFHSPAGEPGFREVEVETEGVRGRVLTRQGYVAN